MAVSKKENVSSPPVGMDFEEFMNWLDEDIRAEWVDGEVVMMSPASRPHQNIVDFLTSVLRAYVEENNLGTLLSAPFVMSMENVAREPDILFVLSEHENRIKDTYIDGPANLVVEVISPESRGRDRFDKFQEYEKSGVQEYWIIDPGNESAEFYVLQDGQYSQVTVDSNRYQSNVLTGLTVHLDWFWQDSMPSLVSVLDDLGLTDA